VLGWARPAHALGRWTKIALVAFGAFVCWSFLSIIWAGDRGLALTGANRALLYLIVFAVLARADWPGLTGLALVSAWSLATTIVGVATLVRAAHSLHAGDFFGGRLESPVEYANGNAALFVLAAWPAVFAAQERRLHPALRAFGLGVAVVATELALLCQSKGAALGVAVTVVVLLAVAPQRARVLVPVVAVAAVVAIFHGPLFDLYHRLAVAQPGDHAVVRSAAIAVGLSFLVAVAGGAALALAERLVDERPRAARAAGRAFVASFALVAAAAALVVVVHYGGPVGTARAAWHSFAQPVGNDTSSHFVSTVGNHRYDFWRVAAHQFRRSPILGAGMDNYAADYVRERRTYEQPLYPHSLEARLLGGLGIVGFLLFAVFAAAALWLTGRAARARSETAVLGLAGLAMLVYWLAHGSVDWLWEFPGVTGPVVAAVACIAAREASTASATAGRRSTVGLACAAVAAAVVLAPSWIAARDIASALAVWHTQLSTAYADLHQAAALNPVTDEPYVVAGTIAERRLDWPRARRQFQLALDRVDENWYSHMELGIALAKLGDDAGARRQLDRAHLLDPRETLVTEALGDLAAHRPINPRALDREIIARTPPAAAR